jgi:5-(aminomethyl)-3-furanmethanol phosphate kinase
MDDSRRIVLKLGGASLFASEGFGTELQSLLFEFRHDRVYLMVGGGDLIESMRTLHRLHPDLDQEEMHWRCIDLLDSTWDIAQRLFPVPQTVRDSKELARFTAGGPSPSTAWIRVLSFYSAALGSSIPSTWLPRANWDTTTDAIAWLLGMIVDADRVVLLKRCPCDSNWSLSQAAELGIVDKEVARLAHENPKPTLSIELRSIPAAMR